jgi:hypothetical protein
MVEYAHQKHARRLATAGLSLPRLNTVEPRDVHRASGKKKPPTCANKWRALVELPGIEPGFESSQS